MTSLTGFSFGSQPLKDASGSGSLSATPNGSQKTLLGGSVLSKTPAGAPPAFPGLFGQGGPVVTGSSASGLPHSSSLSNPGMGSSATGSGLPKTNTVASTQLLSNSPADNLPVSFTPQGFGSTQPKTGSAIWSVPSTSNSTAAGQSATGYVPSASTLSSSNITATSGAGSMFNAVFNMKNATSTGNLSGTPPATGSTFTFAAPQTTVRSNSPSTPATSSTFTFAVPQTTAGSNGPSTPATSSTFTFAAPQPAAGSNGPSTPATSSTFTFAAPQTTAGSNGPSTPTTSSTFTFAAPQPAAGSNGPSTLATSSTFTFAAPQTTAGSNGPSTFATAGNVTPTAPPTSIGSSGQSAESAFPPAQAQPTSAVPSGPSIFAPAQAQPNTPAIGGQLVQLASTAANRPATGLFGVSIAPDAPQAAPGDTSQPFFPPATSGHPGGPTVFSPPAVTSILSAATPATSAVPPVSSVHAPVQTQTSTPPTSILAAAASVLTSAASLGTSLFGSATISTTTSSLSTPTAATAPHTSPAAKPLFAPVTSEDSGVSITPDAKTSLLRVPPTSRLNHNRSLEEIVDRWSSDLETYKEDFIQRGLEVKRLDAIIVENLSKTDVLNIEVNVAERRGDTINKMLDQLASDQEHLERLLDYYEESLGNIEKVHSDYQPVDEERERVLQAVLTINDKLLELGTGLGDMIKELNDANAKVENTTNTENPLFPIVKILNDHLSVMQWVDAQTASLAGKIKNVRVKSMARPRDSEGDEAMRHYHNEYMKTFMM